MDDLPGELHGFTAKTVANPPGIHVRLPDTAVQLQDLSKGDLLHPFSQPIAFLSCAGMVTKWLSLFGFF